eukprot:scaffold30520_cov90-Isochrysis_galbana.AAC.1
MRVSVFSVSREIIDTYDTSRPKLTSTPRSAPADSRADSTRSDDCPPSSRYRPSSIRSPADVPAISSSSSSIDASYASYSSRPRSVGRAGSAGARTAMRGAPTHLGGALETSDATHMRIVVGAGVNARWRSPDETRAAIARQAAAIAEQLAIKDVTKHHTTHKFATLYLWVSQPGPTYQVMPGGEKGE